MIFSNLKKWQEEEMANNGSEILKKESRIYNKHIKNKHRGAISETYACSWLLEKGFEVFRNQSDVGKADIIALNPKNMKVHLFDVKSARKIMSIDGVIKIPLPKLTKKQITIGVKRIVVCRGGGIIMPDSSEDIFP